MKGMIVKFSRKNSTPETSNPEQNRSHLDAAAQKARETGQQIGQDQKQHQAQAQQKPGTIQHSAAVDKWTAAANKKQGKK